MDGEHLRIMARERQAVLEQYRKGANERVRLRAHMLLLLADGYSWALIVGVFFCSTRTIARWKRGVEEEGRQAVLGTLPTVARVGTWWSEVLAAWVLQSSPRDFGFLRSRWSCQVMVLVLLETYELRVSQETVRRWLQKEQLVWRRPCPVVGPSDPQKEAKLCALRQFLASLPANEIAVFQDEVEVHTNPKIGAMWMRRGKQAKVIPPGTSEKRYLAGSLNWRTGAVILTQGLPKEGRTTALFLRHLDDLRSHLLRYRKIHVICDNARSHNSQAVQKYLKWHLHEEVTRCHRCQSMEELLDLVFAWRQTRTPFVVEREVYALPHAA